MPTSVPRGDHVVIYILHLLVATPPFRTAVVGDQIMSAMSDQLTPDRLSIDGYIRRHRSPLESTYSRLNTRDRPSTTLSTDNRSSGGPAEPRTAARVPDTTGHGTPPGDGARSVLEAFGKPTRGAARNSLNLRARNIEPRPFKKEVSLVRAAFCSDGVNQRWGQVPRGFPK